MEYSKEFDELVENFYEIEEIINALEREPKTYNTDELLFFTEAHTLKKIAENEGISQNELARMMYRTKGTTSVIINKLVSKGLVTKKAGKGDMRRNELFLTEKGKSVNDYHKEYDAVKLSEWCNGFSLTKEEIRTANHVLRTCLEAYPKTIYRGKREN